MEEKAANFERALATDEVFEYLIGLKGYAYVCPYANAPTYPSEVFGSIVSFYEISKTASVWDDFEKALLRMSSNESYSWFSLYYLVEYMRYSKRIQPRDLTKLIPAITENIRNLKQEMLQNQEWVGCDYPDGLWGDIQRMIHNINEEMGLHLVV